MRKRVFLRVTERRQQRARRRDDLRLGLQAKLRDAFSELLADEPLARLIFKYALAVVHTAVQPFLQNALQHLAVVRAAAKQHLDRRKAPELVADRFLCIRSACGSGVERTGRNVAEAHAPALTAAADAGIVVVSGFLQHGALRHRAGRHDAHDVALHKPLGKRRIFHLLADGDFISLCDQPRDIAVGGVIRDAAHRRLLLLVLAAVTGREGQIQLPGRKTRVLVEHLIKIAQTEKQQTVRVARFDLAVLLHHGRQLCHILTLFS